MRIKCVLWGVLFLVYLAKSSANEDIISSSIPIFSLQESIQQLITLPEVTSSKNLLQNVNIDFNQLNPAEQYLYLIAQADASDSESHKKDNQQQVITYLLKAQSLESKISYVQLNQIAFINLYKKLAQSYAEIGQFKKAYDAKHIFMAKYDAFLKTERDKHIFELEKKYEIKGKQELNDLLNIQNELKAKEIDEALANEMIQRKNIYIISVVVIVFVLLLIRVLLMNKRLSDLSKKDVLTGVNNKETLFNLGNSVIKRCVNSHVDLCVLAINVNRFSSLNNIHGEAIGDELLKRVALLGAEVMRTRDVLGRIEDATFIAILPEASIDEAKAIAQHLKDKVAAFNFDYIAIDKPININVSIVELSSLLNTFELLLNTAMGIQYDIKNTGGDQIKIYMPEV